MVWAAPPFTAIRESAPLLDWFGNGWSSMAATASHYASGRLHDWWEWSSSGNEAKRLSQLRTTLTKQLESERETLRHGLKALAEERREWAASYKQHHHRGTRHGAEQEPYWTVMLRAMIRLG